MLDAATHHVAHGHARDADLGKGFLQLHEAVLLADDAHARHLARRVDRHGHKTGHVDLFGGHDADCGDGGDEVGICVDKRMLRDVETLDLLVVGDTQADGALDGQEQHDGAGGCPGDYGDDAEELYSEL